MQRKFFLVTFCASFIAGFFLFANLVHAQSQYHLPNPLYLTLRNVSANQEYGNTGQGVRAALSVSPNDTLLFKWAKVEGAQAYWYSSDLTRNSSGAYEWRRLDTSQAQDRGTYYTLEMPASTIPEGTHWFQITACSSNAQDCSQSSSGYPYLYVWVRVGGTVTAPPTAATTPQSLRDAGIELALPSYFPEELRHPQKLFSGREIRIPLAEVKDIKKMRLELENQTVRSQPKTTLFPKDKVLDLLKEKRQEPPEFMSNKADFKIPENLSAGIYNLKLFSENQNLKDVNINIKGANSMDMRYNPLPSIIENRNNKSFTVSRIVERLVCGNDDFGCDWETVFSGDNNGAGMILISTSRLLRNLENWRVDDVDRIFFGEISQPPFYYSGDPKVEVFQDKFYLAANVRFRPFKFPARSGDLSVQVNALYIGCLLNTCSPKVSLLKEPRRELLGSSDDPNADIVQDFPKIALDRQNNIIYISNYSRSEENNFLHSSLFISRDLGNHFEEINLKRIIENQLEGTGLLFVDFIRDLEVGADGKLYVPIYVLQVDSNVENIIMLQIDSSGTILKKRNITNFNNNPSLSPAISSQSDRLWLVDRGPVVAVDRSNGPYRGRIYVMWSRAESIGNNPSNEYGDFGRNFDIFLSYSDDGDVWSNPVKVNDDAGEGDQYFPSIDVDGNGIVNIAFFDHRDNQDAAQFDVYFTFSQDGGKTFSRNIRVNRLSIPLQGGRDWGDYFDLVHGKTGQGISYVGYICINDNYNSNEPAYLFRYQRICIDQIYTGATVSRE